MRISVALFAALVVPFAAGGCGGNDGSKAAPPTGTQPSAARPPARAATRDERVWFGGLAVILGRDSQALRELAAITDNARGKLLGGHKTTVADASIALRYLETCGHDLRKLGRPPTLRTRRMAALFAKGCERFRSGGQAAFLAIKAQDGAALTAGLATLSQGLPYIEASMKLGPPTSG